MGVAIGIITMLVAGCGGSRSLGEELGDNPPSQEATDPEQPILPFQVCMNWDPYWPYLIYAEKYPDKSPEQIYTQLVVDLADAGISRIYYRVSELGRVNYHSGETAWAEHAQAFVLQEIDPLRIIVPKAHECGMEVHVWMTLFESCVGEQTEGYIPLHSDLFFMENPQYMWKYCGVPEFAWDGGTEWYWTGHPCYAYPQVREHRLNEMRELLDYDVDGFLFSLRDSNFFNNRIFRGKFWKANHGTSSVPVPLVFGFNEPVIEEYIKTYGIDPRYTDMDSSARADFVRLTGEVFTRFMREVKDLVGPLPIAMVAPFSWTKEAPFSDGFWNNYIDGKALLQEGIVTEPWHYRGTHQCDFDSLAGQELWECWWYRTYSYTGGNDTEYLVSLLERGLDYTLASPGVNAISFHELGPIVDTDTLSVIKTYLDGLRNSLSQKGG